MILLLTLALAADPGAAELLARAVANEAIGAPARAHFIYREHAEHSSPGGHINHIQDYEWIFLEGQMYRKMVSYNGKSLKGRQAEKEERKFQMTAAERRAAVQHEKPNPRIFSADIPASIVLRVMDHTLAGAATLNGRAAWVIHSAPKPDLANSERKEDEARAYHFTYWIDKADLVIAQEHYEVFQLGAEILPGSSQTTTYTKIADSVWLPGYREGEYYSGPPHPKSHWRQTHRFTDYRKFGSESTVLFQ